MNTAYVDFYERERSPYPTTTPSPLNWIYNLSSPSTCSLSQEMIYYTTSRSASYQLLNVLGNYHVHEIDVMACHHISINWYEFRLPKPCPSSTLFFLSPCRQCF